MKRSGGWLHFPDYFGGQMHSAGPNTSTTGFKHLDAGFVCFAMQPVKRAGICVVQGPQDFVKHADTPRQEAAERSWDVMHQNCTYSCKLSAARTFGVQWRDVTHSVDWKDRLYCTVMDTWQTVGFDDKLFFISVLKPTDKALMTWLLKTYWKIFKFPKTVNGLISWGWFLHNEKNGGWTEEMFLFIWTWRIATHHRNHLELLQDE